MRSLMKYSARVKKYKKYFNDVFLQNIFCKKIYVHISLFSHQNMI